MANIPYLELLKHLHLHYIVAKLIVLRLQVHSHEELYLRLRKL